MITPTSEGLLGGESGAFSVGGWQVPCGVCVCARRKSEQYVLREDGRARRVKLCSPAPVTVSGRVTIAAASELLGRRKSKRPVCEFVQTPVSPTCQGGHGRWCTSWSNTTRLRQTAFPFFPSLTCIVNKEPFEFQVMRVNGGDLISIIPWAGVGRKHFCLVLMWLRRIINDWLVCGGVCRELYPAKIWGRD